MFIKSLKKLVLVLGIGFFIIPTSSHAQENNPYFQQCDTYCNDKYPSFPSTCETVACYICTDISTLYSCVDNVINCSNCIAQNSQCHLNCETSTDPSCDAKCGDPSVVCPGCPGEMYMNLKNKFEKQENRKK